MPIDLSLLLHGLIVLLVGLLAGAPMGRAINQDASAKKIHSWKVAHSGLCMGGIMMSSFSVILGHLEPSAGVRLTIFISLVLSGYGFAIALPIGAITGHRGLKSGGPWQSRVVYMGNLFGAYGSLVATVVLLGLVIARLCA